MKKYFTLLILTVIVLSCRTRKVDVSVARQEESAIVQVTKESNLQKEIAEIKNMVESSRVSSFNQQLSLSPVVDSAGVAQPVKYREIRYGKPYREIIIQGGSLNETKAQSDTLKEFTYKQLMKENEVLTMRLDSLVQVQQELYAKDKHVRVTGFQFWVYVLGALVLLLIYFEYRVRRFEKVFKSYLKEV